MEPRLRGRFHIWHMLTREMPFCNLCASKGGTFERENCFVTPPDGLTAGTLRVFGLRGSTSRGIYRLKPVSLTQKSRHSSNGIECLRKRSLYFWGIFLAGSNQA